MFRRYSSGYSRINFCLTTYSTRPLRIILHRFLFWWTTINPFDHWLDDHFFTDVTFETFVDIPSIKWLLWFHFSLTLKYLCQLARGLQSALRSVIFQWAFWFGYLESNKEWQIISLVCSNSTLNIIFLNQTIDYSSILSGSIFSINVSIH